MVKIDLSEFKNKNDLIKSISNYKFEFGVLTKDEFKSVKVSILNPDESVTEAFMTVGQIMYLTEHGTIMLPARPILSRILPQIEKRIETILEDIIDGVFSFNWNKSDIDLRLKLFENETNLFLQNKIREMIASNSYLSNLVDEKSDNTYLLDLNQLKNYIHFKIIVN